MAVNQVQYNAALEQLDRLYPGIDVLNLSPDAQQRILDATARKLGANSDLGLELQPGGFGAMDQPVERPSNYRNAGAYETQNAQIETALEESNSAVLAAIADPDNAASITEVAGRDRYDPVLLEAAAEKMGVGGLPDDEKLAAVNSAVGGIFSDSESPHGLYALASSPRTRGAAVHSSPETTAEATENNNEALQSIASGEVAVAGATTAAGATASPAAGAGESPAVADPQAVAAQGTEPGVGAAGNTQLARLGLGAAMMFLPGVRDMRARSGPVGSFVWDSALMGADNADRLFQIRNQLMQGQEDGQLSWGEFFADEKAAKEVVGTGVEMFSLMAAKAIPGVNGPMETFIAASLISWAGNNLFQKQVGQAEQWVQNTWGVAPAAAGAGAATETTPAVTEQDAGAEPAGQENAPAEEPAAAEEKTEGQDAGQPGEAAGGAAEEKNTEQEAGAESPAAEEGAENDGKAQQEGGAPGDVQGEGEPKQPDLQRDVTPQEQDAGPQQPDGGTIPPQDNGAPVPEQETPQAVPQQNNGDNGYWLAKAEEAASKTPELAASAEAGPFRTWEGIMGGENVSVGDLGNIPSSPTCESATSPDMNAALAAFANCSGGETTLDINQTFVPTEVINNEQKTPNLPG